MINNLRDNYKAQYDRINRNKIEQTQVGIALNPLNAIACRKWKRWKYIFVCLWPIVIRRSSIFVQSIAAVFSRSKLLTFDWNRFAVRFA